MTVRDLAGRAGAGARADPVLWTAVAVLVLAQAAMRWWALSQSFFFQDDFVYTNLARTLPTTDFLALDYQGHLQPVQFALVAVLARLAPLDWTPHAAVLLGLQLVFDVVFTWLFVRMFGPRPAILVPLAVVLFCPLSLPPLLWFAAALQWLPLAISSVTILLCHVHLVSATGRSRRRWQVAAGLAFLVALASWERSLSLVGVIYLTQATWLSTEHGRARLTAPFRRLPLLWAWYLLLSGGYLVLYATISAGTPTAPPTWSDALALLRETVGTLVPGLLGGPWAVEDGAETLMRPPEHPGPWLVAQAAVLVLALLLTAGPRRLAQAWTVPLALLGLDFLVVLLTRVDFIGALIGRDPRYIVDVVPLAGIALAVTFLPVVGVEPARAKPRTSRWSGWPRPVRRLALVATVGFVVNSSWITTTAIAVGHRDDPGRPWFEQIQREAAALPPGVGVRDAPTPPTVVSALFGDRARLSQVLGSLPEWEGRIGTTTNDLRDARRPAS